MSVDVVTDGFLELSGAGVGTPVDGPLGKQPKPAFDLVEPAAAGRSEMYGVAWIARPVSS